MIKKRDGSFQAFNKQKIVDAILLSGAEDDVAEEIADHIEQHIFEGISIFEIEQLVEESLIRLEDVDAAREYISYRSKRATEREVGSKLFQDVSGIINRTNADAIKENGNTDASALPAQRDLTAGEVAKAFARHILPSDVLEAHEQGAIHYHDLTFAPASKWTNCCLIDAKNMLKQGFTLGGADIESPKSSLVCASVISQIIAQVSSHQYGGTSVANIDEILEPYGFLSYEKHLRTAETYGIPLPGIYAMDLTIKEIYDACQSLEYEINSLFNSHAQSPFTTISFGRTTSWVGREIQKAILKVRIKGLGKNGITPIFPKLVFFHDDNINGKPGTPNYDIKQLALECSAKRLYPDWISTKNNSSITGSSVPVTPMGCRSFLSMFKDQNGQEILDGRNNLGVVTINPVRCALKALDTENVEEAFWEYLEEVTELAHKALKTRIIYLTEATASLAPPLYQQGAFGLRLSPEEKVLPHLIARGCSISLGFIGLHETYNALFGTSETSTPTDLRFRQNFYIEVTQYLRDQVDKWKKEEGIGYSLYATPSESLCHRMLKLDRKYFGTIAGVTDKEYYTNSFHLDVANKVDPFTKIDFEAPFHWISSGGHISYCEFPDMRNNLQALETVVDYAMEKLDYFGVNTPADICLDCGQEVEAEHTAKGYVCPICGSTHVNAVRRICGYLGSINVRPVNLGKSQEFDLRVKHCE